MREGWDAVQLGELLTKRTDFTPIEDGVSYRCAGVQRSGWGIIERDPFVGGISKFTKLMRLEKDDFVYRVITAFEAPSAVVDDASAGLYVSPQTFPVFKVDATRLLPEYLKLLTTDPTFHHEMSERCVGSVLRRMTLSVGALLSIPIALPPLEEQQRIVDLIGSLDDAIEAAEAVSVTSSDAAIELRRNFFESAEGSISVGDVYDVIVGKQLQSKSTTGEPAPYLRAGNIGNGFLDVREMKTMLFTEAELARLQLEQDDVVIVEGGNGYGKSAVWTGQVAGRVALQNHVLRLRATTPGYTSAYAHQWARWCHEQGRFKSTGTGIPNLGVGKIRQMTIPVLNDASALGIELLVSADQGVTAAASNVDSLRAARSELLTVLLSGDHEIPESYDADTAVQLEPAA